MEIRARCHCRRGDGEIEIDTLAFEIDRAVAVAVEPAGLHHEAELLGVTRPDERGRDRHRTEIGQAGELGQQPMRRLADIERDVIAVAAHLARELVAPLPVELLDLQRDIAIGERDDVKIAGNADACRRADQRGAEIEPVDAHLAEHNGRQRWTRFAFDR